jgi:hypothetical protein
MSKKLYQRNLPIAIASIAAIIVILEYFLVPIPEVKAARAEIITWTALCAAFGLFVGAAGTLLLHVSKLRAKRAGALMEEKFLSAIAIGTVILFIIVGTSFPGLTTSPQYRSLFDHVFGALSRSIRAAAFFAALIGAYRAFRVSSIDSFVMWLSACVYLLRSMAAGVYLVPITKALGDWIAEVPSVGATRGALIAAAVGALILSVRVFAGKERSVEEIVAEA